jgi:hypothetical protein
MRFGYPSELTVIRPLRLLVIPIKSLQACDISQHEILVGHHHRIHHVPRVISLFKLRPITKFTCASKKSGAIDFLIETEFRNPGFQRSMLAATSIGPP